MPTQPIAIVTGSSTLARMIIARYRKHLGDENLIVIEERPPVLFALKRFARRRLKARGMLSLVDALISRVWQGIVHRFSIFGSDVPMPEPTLVVANVNEPAVAAHFRTHDVRLVILNLCSVISASQLEAIDRPVINVHPGINPRYRGAGNVWALSEKRLDLVGATVHEVDVGIDTGKVLGYIRIDPVSEDMGVEDTVVAAQIAGADLAIAFLRGLPLPPIPDEFRSLESRFYGYPGMTTWLRAWFNLRLARRARGDCANSHKHMR